GTDDNHASQLQQRVVFRDNLFERIDGLAFQLLAPAWVKIDHNTVFQTYNIISADSGATEHFFFTNNIAPHNDYGIIGSGHGPGKDSIATFFPGGAFLENVLVGADPSAYPADNFFPATMGDVGF